jgi:hypothetical protein
MLKKLFTIALSVLPILIMAFGLLSFSLVADNSVAVYAVGEDVCKLSPKDCNNTIVNITDNFSFAKIPLLILGWARWGTIFCIAIAVVFLVYGGFKFIFDTKGDGSGAEQGKKIIKNALIGLLIAVLAFTIVQLLINLAGSDLSAITNPGDASL